jgi:ParB-like nuclease domain
LFSCRLSISSHLFPQVEKLII